MCRPIRSVMILVIKQFGLSLRGRPILLITRMITDRIGLHSVLLPLLIVLRAFGEEMVEYLFNSKEIFFPLSCRDIL